jgi:hypothetical protein
MAILSKSFVLYVVKSIKEGTKEERQTSDMDEILDQNICQLPVYRLGTREEQTFRPISGEFGLIFGGGLLL